MSSAWYVVFVGLAAGVLGTGVGGFLVSVLNKPSDRVFSMVLGFSGGIMLSIVSFDLMPEAFEVAGVVWGITGLIVGTALVAMVDFVVPHMHFMSTDCESSRFIRAGLFVGLGIAMHNLPEGMAIGAGFISSERFGLGVALLMTIQNMPEGMAMAAPMCRAGVTPLRAGLLACLAGVPMGVGALIGATLGSVSPVVLSLSLGFAAGAMLFITCDELIPDAQEFRAGHTGTFGIVAGVVTGIVVSTLASVHF